MSKINKVLLIIFSIIFAALVGFLVYINFFDSPIDFIKTKQLVTIIFAFLIAIIRILSRGKNKSWLTVYKKTYEDTIKDSFDDNKRNLKTLLNALRLIDEEKYQESINLLQSLEEKCQTRNEQYSIKLFIAVNNKYLGNIEKAVEIYEEMINRGLADSRIFSNLLNCYSELGEYDKAYDTGMRAIHADPKNHNAYHNFAFFLFEDGNYEEAEDYAKKALEINNKLIETITLLYIIYSIEGREEEAEIYAKKSIANGRSRKELKEILEYYI